MVVPALFMSFTSSRKRIRCERFNLSSWAEPLEKIAFMRSRMLPGEPGSHLSRRRELGGTDS